MKKLKEQIIKILCGLRAYPQTDYDVVSEQMESVADQILEVVKTEVTKREAELTIGFVKDLRNQYNLLKGLM